MWKFDDYSNNLAILQENENHLPYSKIQKLQQKFYHHINRRTLLFILANNNLESFVAYISCIQNHVVVAMLTHKLTDDDLFTLIEKYQPEYLWIDEKQRTITTLPLSYSYGLSIVNSFLSVGHPLF